MSSLYVLLLSLRSYYSGIYQPILGNAIFSELGKFSQRFAEIGKNNKIPESLPSVYLGVAWFPGPAFIQGARGPG